MRYTSKADRRNILDSELELFKSLWDLVHYLLLHGGAAGALHFGVLLPAEDVAGETAMGDSQSSAPGAKHELICILPVPLARIVWRRKREMTCDGEHLDD